MTWVHWVLCNLPADCAGLPEGVHVRQICRRARPQGLNDWRRTGYGGPCPPIGEHRYFHKLYALDALIQDLRRPDKATVERGMRGHVLAEAVLIGTYRRAWMEGCHDNQGRTMSRDDLGRHRHRLRHRWPRLRGGACQVQASGPGAGAAQRRRAASRTPSPASGWTWGVGVHYLGDMGQEDEEEGLLEWISGDTIQMASMGAVYDTIHFPGGFVTQFVRPEEALKRELKEKFPASVAEIDSMVRRPPRCPERR